MLSENHTSRRPNDWLPPLNSHQNSTIRIHIYETGDELPRPPVGTRRVCSVVFLIDVRVDFYLSHDPTKTMYFNALNCRMPISCSVEDLKQRNLCLLRAALFNDEYVPFPLDGSYCTEQGSNGACCRYNLPGGKDQLVKKVVDYAHVLAQKPGPEDLYVTVGILKRVLVPGKEFWECVSWYNDNKSRDRNFDSKYLNATAWPRATWRSRSWMQDSSWMQDNKSVKLEIKSCSICLDEFCDGESSVRKLSCGHPFHQECIDKWLRTTRNNVCPLCRCPVAGRREVEKSVDYAERKKLRDSLPAWYTPAWNSPSFRYFGFPPCHALQ